MKKSVLFAVFLLPLIALSSVGSSGWTIPLDGEWSFQLDPNTVGVEERWFERVLPDRIQLPGSTDEHGFGQKNTEPVKGRWTRLYEYEGAAWYQRDFVVPDGWAGRDLSVFLERCHWESRLWVDNLYVGMRDSLSAPHEYGLGTLKPGKHRLTVRVDNRMKVDIGKWAAAITDESQSNWNGIIGCLELRSTAGVWVERVDVFPQLDKKCAQVRLHLRRTDGGDTSGKIRLVVRSPSQEGKSKGVETVVDFELKQSKGTVDATLDLSSNLHLWDEFSPVLYELVAEVEGQEGAGYRTTFGLRSFTAGKKHFVLNDRKVFLRGHVDYGQNPRTGYPEMTVDGWLRIFRIAKDWGLNFMRFHSWCPPEAAFIAADQVGFLLQIELPNWVNDGDFSSDPALMSFLDAEADRIIQTYGNHPSFCMMSMGNELGEITDPYIHNLVRRLQQMDSRRLYMCSSAPVGRPGQPDDYFEAGFVEKGGIVGIRHIMQSEPNTMYDYRELFASVDRPMTAHENGHYCMFVDLRDREKYTGPVRPLYLDLYEADLKRAGLLELAGDFVRASGALSAALYKEEVESALRTPNHAGFSLLGLTDYHGQGTALVGLLDTFWDSKGIISSDAFREFCAPTVPLLRMEKRTVTTGEHLIAKAEIAHYGPRDLPPCEIVWEVRDETGQVVLQGSLGTHTLPTGELTSVGEFTLDLQHVAAPRQLTVWLSLKGHPFRNSWKIWLYPDQVTGGSLTDGPVVARRWDADCRRALEEGRDVLLIAAFSEGPRLIPDVFRTVFWSYGMFPNQPPTHGLLIDADHPALAEFPTSFHGDWQWADLINRSMMMDISELPCAPSPIIRAIDTYERNRSLATLFEARCGEGRLLVCGYNLVDELGTRPAARQLRKSLLTYMNSKDFKPAVELPFDQLDALFDRGSDRGAKGVPEGAESAVLRVKGGIYTLAYNALHPWRPQNDHLMARAAGFDYSVRGGTWQNGTIGLWRDPQLRVTISCPENFAGTLYVHFLDPSNSGQISKAFFEGRDLGFIGPYHGDGIWIELEVAQYDTADGQLVLQSNASAGEETMIAEILLLED